MHELEEVLDGGGSVDFVLADRWVSMVRGKVNTKGGCADLLEAKLWRVLSF